MCKITLIYLTTWIIILQILFSSFLAHPIAWKIVHKTETMYGKLRRIITQQIYILKIAEKYLQNSSLNYLVYFFLSTCLSSSTNFSL